MKKSFKNLAMLSVVLILWIIFSRNSNPLFLPKPEEVYGSFSDLGSNGMMQSAIQKSFYRITVAALISSVISVPIGLFVVNYRMVDELITPVTSIMRYIPVTVFYPLFIMWLGIDETMKIAFLFTATFFYLLPTVIFCLKDTSQDLIDTAYTMGMNKFQVMFKVYLPYSAPSIFENFLMMYSIGWTYIIVAETINAKAGLGYIMNIGSARGRTDMVFAAILTILIISVAFDALGKYLIRKSFKWKYAREIDD